MGNENSANAVSETVKENLTPEQSRALYQQMYHSSEESETEATVKWAQDAFNYEPWPLWLAQLICKKKDDEPWPAWIEATFKSQDVALSRFLSAAILLLAMLVVYFRELIGHETASVLFKILLYGSVIMSTLFLFAYPWIFGSRSKKKRK